MKDHDAIADASIGVPIIQEIADHSGGIGMELCDIAGNVEEIAERVRHQVALLKELHGATRSLDI